jgi:heme/copper-type cytochrome/quinol oxidase subunit 2
MFDYEILRNRWVILVLFIGIALVLWVCLMYIDLWKPRKMKDDSPDEPETGYLGTWEGIPWTIKVISVVIILAMGYYTVELFIHPENW